MSRISFDDDSIASAADDGGFATDIAVAVPQPTSDRLEPPAAPSLPDCNPADWSNVTSTIDHYTDAPLPTRAVDPNLFSDELSPDDSAVDPASDDAIASDPTPETTIAEEDAGPSPQTIALAVRDVRLVLQEQREQGQILTTKLNILFVTNGALLTSLSISRLIMIPSPFTVAEVIGFFISFTLLVRAFLPRQVAVSPNLEDRKFLERYLALSAPEYQLQMLVNWSETYNANKQRLDDVSKTLRLAAYATLTVATTILIHILAVYVF